MSVEPRATLPDDKTARYAALRAEIRAVIMGEPNLTARYASAASMLANAFPEHFFWTGFYLVDAANPSELVVGPYQGTLGCLRIPIGKGVCGAAAAERKTIVVADVHRFPGHIACDSRSNSEIVTPFFDQTGQFAGVLDVDSTAFDAFDADDQIGLENICADLLTTP